MTADLGKHPFFSLILPTYNRVDMIGRSIESVIEQTFENWELIIVDDGSEDNTSELVSKYQDPRIKYFYKEHEERSIARNYGVKKGKGKYYCFIDSDDFLLPNHLANHNEQIEQNASPIAAFCSGVFIETNGQRSTYPHLFDNEEALKNLWNKGYNLLPFSWHKEIVKSIQFEPELIYMEDLYFILSAIRKHPLFPVFESTCVVLQHENRSTEKRFSEGILSEGKKSLYSIDKIILEHKAYLDEQISHREIMQKRNRLLRAFIKASIKKGDFKALFWFLGHLF